jgi:hypothetical protein
MSGIVNPKGGKDGSYVPIHEDGKVLTNKYLHQLESSIKCRTPIAGAGITVNRTDGGSTISLVGMTAVTLNVCSNGTPDTLYVLASKEKI